MASLMLEPNVFSQMVSVEGELYVLGGSFDTNSLHTNEQGTTVQCYDPHKNEWMVSTNIPFDKNLNQGVGRASVCSMRLYKEFLSRLQEASSPNSLPTHESSGGSRIFEREVADLTDRYQNNPRQNRLSDSFVPFLNFKLRRSQRWGWLATQSIPLDPPLESQDPSFTI